MASTMKAVVLKQELTVEVQDRPRPTIQDDRDVIIQVHYAGLCGESIVASCDARQGLLSGGGVAFGGVLVT